ncbi:MAG: acyl-CoA dehydrogenase family protein, partial [Calditrichaeota bacterium]|nr:acyl-CoA dehydrogenase family protein [Calditrichota bacterium]
MGITEPNAGSDISSIKTTAVKDGDYYVLNGTKRFITNGYSANVFVIWATLDPSLGREAYRSFIITRGTPGLIPGKKEDKLGIRASETAEVYMEDCRVHKDMMMGDSLEAAAEKKAAAGFSGAKAMFDSTRPMVGSMGVGIGRSAYDFAVEWCQ